MKKSAFIRTFVWGVFFLFFLYSYLLIVSYSVPSVHALLLANCRVQNASFVSFYNQVLLFSYANRNSLNQFKVNAGYFAMRT